MTADLARLRAAQTAADEIAARFNASRPLVEGPLLRVSVSDPESGQRLATAFVGYDVPESTPVSVPSPSNRLRLLPGLLVAAILLLLAGCGPTFEQGPPGTVTDTHRQYWPATKQWHFKLTVRKADGSESTFRVKRSVYRACDKGDVYPACTP